MNGNVIATVSVGDATRGCECGFLAPSIEGSDIHRGGCGRDRIGGGDKASVSMNLGDGLAVDAFFGLVIVRQPRLLGNGVDTSDS